MPGINLQHLKYEVVEPALVAIGLECAAALSLVTGTALAESGAEYLKQIGTGPALGLWQMEPATEQDIWSNFLAYQHDLASKVRGLLTGGATTPQLIGNLPYAAAMCRIKYLRAPDALPAAKDAAGMAAYHKTIYNTAQGAADAATNTPLFEQAIDA
jgi:hypothetical protein